MTTFAIYTVKISAYDARKNPQLPAEYFSFIASFMMQEPLQLYMLFAL
jgi:hypothetical protein